MVLLLKSRFPVAKSTFKKSIVCFLGSVMTMVLFLTSLLRVESLTKSFNPKKLIFLLEVESNSELLSLIVIDHPLQMCQLDFLFFGSKKALLCQRHHFL